MTWTSARASTDTPMTGAAGVPCRLTAPVTFGSSMVAFATKLAPACGSIASGATRAHRAHEFIDGRVAGAGS